jgi:hypothetical protein
MRNIVYAIFSVPQTFSCLACFPFMYFWREARKDLSDAAAKIEKGRTFSPSMVPLVQESETESRSSQQLIH